VIRALALAIALCLSTPSHADPIVPADYDALALVLTDRVGFDLLPTRPEPGFNLDHTIYVNGLRIGEYFAGQVIGVMANHDTLARAPAHGPLSVRPGAPGQNLSVAHHRGFESNALFPLGPAGYPALQARGEGAAAVLFPQPQAAFGLKVHADYPDPLGAHPPAGTLTLTALSPTGAVIAQLNVTLKQGVNALAFHRLGNVPDIAGVVITNSDPGGIAIDDIIFSVSLLLS